MKLVNNYRADGVHEAVCNLVSAHVCVNVKCSCQLLAQMRVNYVLQLHRQSAAIHHKVPYPSHVDDHI